MALLQCSSQTNRPQSAKSTDSKRSGGSGGTTATATTTTKRPASAKFGQRPAKAFSHHFKGAKSYKHQRVAFTGDQLQSLSEPWGPTGLTHAWTCDAILGNLDALEDDKLAQHEWQVGQSPDYTR